MVEFINKFFPWQKQRIWSNNSYCKYRNFTNKLLDRQIVVKGNSKIHKAAYDQLTAVLEELRRIENGEGVNDELLDNTKLVASVIENLYICK